MLRDAFPDRWVRFHSLPKSKRYAEDELEYGIILHRHNAVLGHLASPDETLTFSSTYGSDSPEPARNDDDPLINLDASSTHWHSCLDDTGDGDHWFRHLFMSEWRWQTGTFDLILRLVADWKTVDTMIISTQSSWLFHPYDGGADVILATTTQRDRLKQQFADWLSAHPRGL